MNTKIKLILLLVTTSFFLYNCKKEPKLTPMAPKINNVEKIIDSALSMDLHTVVIKEILPSSKNYVYLKVQEGEEQFWISTLKQEVKVGETYFYNEALLKTDFESSEHNRVFDKIYLVTNLRSTAHGNETKNETSNSSELVGNSNDIEDSKQKPIKIIEQKGSIKIAELVNNPKKYEGKTIQVSGECTKINVGIMNRNWIHLQDGSKDDFDLIITSDENVEVGTVVTMKALVTLNKDFGAGYKYDLILENGTIVP